MSKHNMKNALDNFINEIKSSEEFKSYEEALKKFNADKSTQELLANFREAQQTLMIFRQGGFAGIEEQERKVKWLRKKVNDNNLIQNMLKTQNEFQLLVFNLADSISRDIGFQFAPPQRSGCCG